MKNIVLFGGAFDPVHVGHLAIYKKINSYMKVDKFIIIPSKNPPLKDVNETYAPPFDRLNMLKLMFNKYKNIKINKYEIDRNDYGISYTINTIKYFYKKYPHDKLYFVIGDDRYSDFKSWYKWQEILKYVHLLVVNRNNDVNTDYLKLGKVTFIKMNKVKISSTLLRVNPLKKFLTLPIAKYIATNGLYIKNQIEPLMSNKRYQHTLRVSKLACELIKVIKPSLLLKTYIASMYHDVAKEFNEKQIIQLVGHNYDKKRFCTIHTLHGLASAKYIEKHFNITDKQILNAIANHVVPPKNPTILDMVLYCADKLEPARTTKDVSNRLGYLNEAKKNLKKTYWKLYKEINAHYN